jgi:hypothetical protein
MQDFLNWGALIAPGGSIIAIVAFWMNIDRRWPTPPPGRECLECDPSLSTKHEALAAQLADTRVTFASE